MLLYKISKAMETSVYERSNTLFLWQTYSLRLDSYSLSIRSRIVRSIKLIHCLHPSIHFFFITVTFWRKCNAFNVIIYVEYCAISSSNKHYKNELIETILIGRSTWWTTVEFDIKRIEYESGFRGLSLGRYCVHDMGIGVG